MSSAMTIRFSEPRDRDALLAFIERMGFNPRDATTWDALEMAAITAWRDDQLVGAIPFEPRHLQIRPGLVVPSIHETVVAVDPELRGTGIGTRMQNAILSVRPGGALLASVFREEPDSPAYRWYVRNDFTPAMRIDSWFIDHATETGTQLVFHDPTINPPPWAELTSLWRHHGACNSGGCVDRTRRDLAWWLRVHPYRNRYQFQILCLRDGPILIAYALVGLGRMHSDTLRLDLLEAVAQTRGALHDLIAGVLRAAVLQECRSVRWALAQGDASAEIARELGFEARWSFDMLVRPLVPEVERDLDASRASWGYAGIDYI